MNRAIAFVTVVAAAAALGPSRKPQSKPRPPITGIAYVRVALSDPRTGPGFYTDLLRLPVTNTGCPSAVQACFIVNGAQQVQTVSTVGLKDTPSGQLPLVAFATTSVDLLRRYFVANALSPGTLTVDANRNKHFEIEDPDGHPISFVELAHSSSLGPPAEQVGLRIIHAGFVVNDRAAEDKFYKDLLGFRIYWHGGMKDTDTDWVDMQVPDGTDWLEYMLNVAPNADHRTLGVMNHIALGVADIHAAEQQIKKNGGNPGEQPQIGRDGKWQLNLYDPNQTRVEIMEFKPVQKPCCADYTGQHPGSE
jgi:catechol 2,3-dioxygenase-like lactoylglutathione lyase family enzyme